MHYHKDRQLGMPYGTACSKLRKALLFELAKETSKDICFRCQKKIDTVEEFSIDHKIPWFNGDNSLFWDLSNIAYSHLSCNCKSKRKPKHSTNRKPRTKGSKITIEKAKEIKDRITLGKESLRAIARDVGLHHSTIQSIAKGKCWTQA